MPLFTTLIYQPFFNLLVAFYYLTERLPFISADMGIAVILFTLTIRILLLPLTLAGMRSKSERHEIQQSILKAKNEFENQPHRQKTAVRLIFRSNRRVLISEAVNFAIQMIIFFILYRIFTTGLLGADLHLLYDFMPAIAQPFNLTFLGRFDLTHTNLFLNLLQSFTIFMVEAVSLINSPFPTSRQDLIRYLFILPIASFFIFMFLPAGKKLFVITTLWFSFIVVVIDLLSRFFSQLLFKPSR